jgi:DNA repair protein RecO (recombination protein O)
MNQIVTKGIVLARTDFGEADRILTLLTPDHGKLRLMAKGVRRIKSKLAGGIELFSVSDVTFIRGRGDIGRLVSARLNKHYKHIVKDINRTMLGYELIKQLNKATEDELESEYFSVLEQAFEALNDAEVNEVVIRLWFSMQLLRIAGHMPNLQSDTTGNKLAATQAYDFDFDHMAFTPKPIGQFNANHIKFLRLGFSSGNTPRILQKVQGNGEFVRAIIPFINVATATYMSQLA